MHGLNSMKIKVLFMIGTVLFAGLASCSTVTVTAASSTPMNERAYADLGKTDSTDSTWSIFGLWMIGRPDMEIAINDAIAKKGGEALVNVTMRQRKIWFFFASIDTVIVEGSAVKFYVEEGVPENETKTE